MRSRKVSSAAHWSRRKFLVASAVIAGAQATAARGGILLGDNPGAPSDLTARLAAIEAAVEESRKAIGIHGAALAIVKDDQVIFAKGFGVRDLAGGLPVTPETLFCIASDTKAFTAAAAVMSADDGLISLDDSPKRYLPYFRLRDREADAQVTLRDLMNHGSGLMRTDWPWITGVLSREEAIRVAGLAKPTAKLRQAFQYQNVMYMAAGEAIGRANNTTWEQVIADRLLTPLGMTASTTSIAAMRRTANFATGHERVGDAVVPAAIVDRTNIGAAGAITSNIDEMTRWLRLMLGGGTFEGRRIVSAKGFETMTTRQIATVDGGYGLGFFLGSRNGIKTIWHGGNIDGFNSHVFLVPEHRLGFVLLTNIASSKLPSVVENAVWQNLLVRPAATAAPIERSDQSPQSEAGRYVALGVYLDVVVRDGRLYAVVPDRGEAPMTAVGPRRYRFEQPAPDGFFLTFRPSEARPGQDAAFLEQPPGLGDLELIKLAAANPGAGPSAAARELLGSYSLRGMTVRIEVRGDFAVIIVPGQHPYHLVEQEHDTFVLAELGSTYRIVARRDAAGALTGIAFKQPEGEFPAARVTSAAPARADISVDELMTKAIAAVGGEATLRGQRSLRLVTDYEFENMGLTGEGTMTSMMARTRSSTLTLLGLGKQIGRLQVDCVGAESRAESTFSTGVDTGSCASEFDYASLLDWKTWWTAVTIDRMAKVEGEDVYVVIKIAKDRRREIDYISIKSFLLLQRDTEAPVEGVNTRISTETYSGYREVEGITMPMRVEGSHLSLGRFSGRVREVRYV